MTGTIYLIGGGEIRNNGTQLIDQDLSSLAPKGAEFVFFGTASEDNNDYAEVIKTVYGSHFEVKIATRKKGKGYAVRAIESASVIYLGGGQTELLLKLFSEWDIKDHLFIAMKRGAHIAGISAGAQALSSYYVDEESELPCVKKGWGLVHGCVYVHANLDSLKNAKKLWAEHSRASQYPFIAISENTAWRISLKGEEKIGTGEIWLSRQ
jgi:peptidase E